jgi:hypothetical protein
MMDILDRYIEELKEDLKIDEFTIKDASLKSPGRKHFWTSRLITHKRNLLRLENEKNNIIKRVSQEIQYTSPVKISNVQVEKSAQNTDLMKDINSKINEEKLIIEFLEKTEKTLSSLTYDIKNIVEIMKLEQM